MTPPSTADFSIKPTLRGELATLRPFSPSDLPLMRALLADPEVLRLTGSVHRPPGPSSVPESEPDAVAGAGPGAAEESRVTEWYRTRAAQTDRLDLAVVDRETRRCVGESVLNDWSPGNRSCSFRILIGPEGRDRGLGTEAVRLTVGYGFEELGLHRISLEVYAFNPRARRAYEKVGFRPEGTLRHALRWEDGWVDATVMSLLAHEWAEHRGHPEGPGRPGRDSAPR